MAVRSLADMVRVGAHVLNTTVSTATKKILAQIGSNEGEGQTEADNVEWWQHVGFASRAPNPNKGKGGKEATQAIVVRAGGRDVAFASQDLRGLDLYGNLSPGETCIYSSGPDGSAQARVLLKADGSINLYTTEGNASGGTSMGVFVNTDGSINVASSKGNALLLGSDGSVKVFNASGGLQIKDDGSIKLASGAKVEISGGSITMGGGPLTGPLAMGANVVSALTAIEAQITALVTGLTAVAGTAGPITGVHASAAAAAASQVAAQVATLSTALPLIPTKRVQGD